MQTSAGTPVWVNFLPIAIVLVILIVRFARPQKISVTRMWVSPIVLCLIAGWSIYVTERIAPAPVWEIALFLVLGLLAGVPLGVLRGIHTDVRLTDRKGVMYLGSSWVTMAIFVGAFGLRTAIRALLPAHNALSTAIGDGLIAFAIGFIATSYIAIFRKYEAELAESVNSQTAPATGP
jgi:hypothetical protein